MAFGLKHPLVPNDSEAHRRENRRALITPSKS
jgi:outer membrane protein OmpA-like peptidoglycan-associated protein